MPRHSGACEDQEVTSQGSWFNKTAVIVTQITAIGLAVLAGWMTSQAERRGHVLLLVLGACLALLVAWGTLRLRPLALDLAAGTWLFIAFFSIFGAFMPCGAPELGQRCSEVEAALHIPIWMGFGGFAIFVAACVDHVRVTTMEQPPSWIARKRIAVQVAVLLVFFALCLMPALVAGLHRLRRPTAAGYHPRRDVR